MSKSAIVFSVEHKGNSNFEKMAIGLAHTIRTYDKDIDIYCGNFTNNKSSKFGLEWFDKLDVNYVNDTQFDSIDEDDSFCFLRTYCKDYFAKRLLKDYDYLIYLDVDVVQFNPIELNFDPTAPMVLVHTMPDWVRNYHSQFLTNLSGPLYYNWIDIVNDHNQHLYNIDWTDPKNLTNHEADVILSNKINQTELTIVEQTIGGYHTDFMPNKNTVFYHYDDLGDDGSLYLLEAVDAVKYKRITMFFETILNIKITNQPSYWDQFK